MLGCPLIRSEAPTSVLVVATLIPTMTVVVASGLLVVSVVVRVEQSGGTNLVWVSKIIFTQPPTKSFRHDCKVRSQCEFLSLGQLPHPMQREQQASNTKRLSRKICKSMTTENSVILNV